MILHERWFTDESRFPVQFDTWSSPNSLVPIAIAVGITVAATLIWRARGRHSVVPGPITLGMPWENYVLLLTWVPLVIGVHMGVTLLVSGVNRQLFIPNLVLPLNLLGGVLGMVEIAARGVQSPEMLATEMDMAVVPDARPELASSESP